jgi:Na+-driven multidrug efflux pump
MIWSFGFAAVVCIILNLFAVQFLSIYGQGASFIQAAIPVLRVVSVAMLVMSLATIWLSAVTGTGQSVRTLYIETIAIVIYVIYVYTTMEYYNLPITIGWMSELVYWTSLLIPSYLYIKSNKWKNKKI